MITHLQKEGALERTSSSKAQSKLHAKQTAKSDQFSSARPHPRFLLLGQPRVASKSPVQKRSEKDMQFCFPFFKVVPRYIQGHFDGSGRDDSMNTFQETAKFRSDRRDKNLSSGQLVEANESELLPKFVESCRILCWPLLHWAQWLAFILKEIVHHSFDLKVHGQDSSRFKMCQAKVFMAKPAKSSGHTHNCSAQPNLRSSRRLGLLSGVEGTMALELSIHPSVRLCILILSMLC